MASETIRDLLSRHLSSSYVTMFNNAIALWFKLKLFIISDHTLHFKLIFKMFAALASFAGALVGHGDPCNIQLPPQIWQRETAHSVTLP